MFTYLNQLPQISGSIKKETGFFVPARYNRTVAPMDEYRSLFATGKTNFSFNMEASSGYLYGEAKKSEISEEDYSIMKKLVSDDVNKLSDLLSMDFEKIWNI